MTDETFPRRNDILRCTDEENAIRAVVDRVEALGAHPQLTDCVVLLDQARRTLADWVDAEAPPKATKPCACRGGVGDENCPRHGW